MPALTTDEQELFDLCRRSMPDWYIDDEIENEHVGAAAKIMGDVRAFVAELFARTYVLTSPSATSIEPDWLDQLARDRGTRRRSGESDPALRERLRNIEDMITRPSLLLAVQAILAADGVVGTAVMVELPRDAAFFGVYTSETGTGGTFVDPVGTGMVFTPTVPFRVPPYRPFPVQMKNKLVLSGASAGGNNGTFVTTGAVVNGAAYVNAGGVAGADVVVTWTLQKTDQNGVVLDGWRRAYFGRGYRLASRNPAIVVILPYGTGAATERSVAAMLRQKAAGGVRVVVERRTIP